MDLSRNVSARRFSFGTRDSPLRVPDSERVCRKQYYERCENKLAAGVQRIDFDLGRLSRRVPDRNEKMPYSFVRDMPGTGCGLSVEKIVTICLRYLEIPGRFTVQ
jgi:hypothetical protein